MTNPLRLALFQPEIPPNTGNIIRLCANTGAALDLIHPLGFVWDDKRLRRAGLDYAEWASIVHHDTFEDFLAHPDIRPERVFCFTTRGHTRYDTVRYEPGDVLLLGPESRGLPEGVLNQFAKTQWTRLPMRAHSRSLNMSNVAAIALYEAWRQCDFAD